MDARIVQRGFATLARHAHLCLATPRCPPPVLCCFCVSCMGAKHHAPLENRWCSQGRCGLTSGQGCQACNKHFFESSCFEVARPKHGQSQESLQAWSTQQSCQGAAWQSLWQHSSGESLGPRIGQAARHARGLGAAADFQSTVAAASAANDPACRSAHRQKLGGLPFAVHRAATHRRWCAVLAPA